MNFAGTSTLLSRAAFALCALLAAPSRAWGDPPPEGPPRLLWTFGAQSRPLGVLARAERGLGERSLSRTNVRAFFFA